jgi:3D (Asp-Asp-Asp) domain-containing protein
MRTALPLSRALALALLGVASLLGGAGCVSPYAVVTSGVRPLELRVVATGYCACGACCGWRRTWYGKPVHAYGPREGQPKSVGITASGKRARFGTIAADTARYPFGTIVYIEGYGWGRVEDRGSNIKGDRMDLYFPTHREAKEWGRQAVVAQVWFVSGAR